MADLTVDDVIAFTGDRLTDTDETQRLLDSALAFARSYCGWHVCPVVEAVEITVDGSGSTVLQLPTGKLLELTDITENGVALDITALQWSPGGAIRKLSGGFWTCRYQAITATISHGWTETEAADWRQAVLKIVDDMSLMPSGLGSASDLVRKRVDNVEYQWATTAGGAVTAPYDVDPVLVKYQLPPLGFA